ncbi:hypothetical protein GMDG_00840 [Pseudogymnoascus destructans 20631-21]|uniref:Uncharacterized protein n=1 Tax=Pseudogymnoascus destructans (strain ATCC MYA-4855 / 20631-21) TaxID=658429 RepID=L8GCL5_PSED2|nr:hypothetical protein GMDG_00840 [Pseudogymnoascus destructans 20631-21]
MASQRPRGLHPHPSHTTPPRLRGSRRPPPHPAQPLPSTTLAPPPTTRSGDPVRAPPALSRSTSASASVTSEERQRVADAVKHHLRDRNRAPSEPAELLEAVRGVLRGNVAQLAEDDWMYEAESEEVGLR